MSGMSEETARGNKYSQKGVAGSRMAAADDLQNAKKYLDKFQRAADETGMDRNVLQAIASRESRIKTELLSSGGMGYDKHGYGFMQVDDRTYTPDKSGGPDSYNNILQGAKILNENIEGIKKIHPDWTPEQQFQGGIAGYNCGFPSVPSSHDLDGKTTGKDYSNDVLARTKYFKEQGL